MYPDRFPSGCIRTPFPPLQEIACIKYKNASGVLQTLDSSEYVVDIFSEPGLICFAYGKAWPSTCTEINSVQLRFVAGYGAAAHIPQEIKQAILLMIADLYDHRGGDEGIDRNINDAIESLLWPDRIGVL